MGLFDKKKKERAQAESAADNITLEDNDLADADIQSRRFYVLVEGITTMLGGSGNIIIGNLSGSLKKDDAVYIYQAGETPVSSKITALEKQEEGKSIIADEAENTKVSLQMQLPEGFTLRKFAVITNVAPQDGVDPKVPIENPALAGIVTGMPIYSKDNGFHATVAYWVSHARFITPIKIDKDAIINKDGVASLPNKTKVGFYMLKSTVKLNGTPEDKDSMVLPLFTDWEALKKWEGLKKDGEKIHTQVISFQGVYSMLKSGNVYAGIAINPFSSVPCTLPIPYLDTITGTPGYQNEFGGGEQSGNIREEKVPAGKQILLGVPKDCEESTAIRDILNNYGKEHDEIQSISFLTKVEEDTKIVRHLVVLEFPEQYTTEEMKPHMEAIYQEIKPVAHEINQIEYAIKGRIQAIDSIVLQHQDKMVVYSK
ncbi:MAG: enhanced serine sensitivity protein SseB [Pseudobutyrivibrio sp.]|nr:enhanced serine sensitivity protein SseB [Pseudobutyrivibrio sp.]